MWYQFLEKNQNHEKILLQMRYAVVPGRGHKQAVSLAVLRQIGRGEVFDALTFGGYHFDPAQERPTDPLGETLEALASNHTVIAHKVAAVAAQSGQSGAADAEERSFVFVDPVSQKLLALAQRVAQAGVTTLLTGCGWWLRGALQHSAGISGVAAGLEAAGPSGEMDLDPQRSLPLGRAGPRCAYQRRSCGG